MTFNSLIKIFLPLFDSVQKHCHEMGRERWGGLTPSKGHGTSDTLSGWISSSRGAWTSTPAVQAQRGSCKAGVSNVFEMKRHIFIF